MKTTLAALAVSLLVTVTAAAQISGAWTAEWEGEGKVQLNLTRHGNHDGETMNAADFTGLPPGAVSAAAKTPVNFQLRREAGTIAFEGTFLNGYGAGQFTFTPNPAYAATLRALGVTWDDGVDDNHLMTMALLDVSTDYIRAMQAAGYHETGNRYVEMKIFKVTPEFIRQLKDAGYDHVSARELVQMRIHGITPEYIKQMNGSK